MQKVEAFLLARGVPPEIVAKLAAIEGHAKEIVWMVLVDGEASAIAFINAEYEKVIAAVKAA